MDFIGVTMHNIDCDKVSAHCIAMLEANQMLEAPAREALEKEITKVCSATDQDKQIRSYRLGFVILDAMGERFVEKLFSNPRPEFLIKAPTVETSQAAAATPNLLGFKNIFGTKQPEYFWHFAYGTSMSQARFTRRLVLNQATFSGMARWGSCGQA